MKPNIGKAIVGGLVATTVMTFMMYFVAPMLLGEPMDIAATLGGMTGLGWTAGLIIHLMLGGVVFPLVYRALYRSLAGRPWERGLLWGIALWLAAETVLMPMAGAGFFHVDSPGGVLAAMLSLMGHGVYGTILGVMAGPATAPRMALPLALSPELWRTRERPREESRY